MQTGGVGAVNTVGVGGAGPPSTSTSL